MSFFFGNRKSKIDPLFSDTSAESISGDVGRSTNGRSTTNSRLSRFTNTRFTTGRNTTTRKTSTFELNNIYKTADDFSVGIQEILGKFRALKFDSARKTHYINVPPTNNSVSSCITANSEHDTYEELSNQNDSIGKDEPKKKYAFWSRIGRNNHESKNELLKSSQMDRLMLHCSLTMSTFKVTNREPIFSYI